MDASSAARRTAGDNAKRKGFAASRRVVSVSSADAVWMSRGRSSSLRAVSSDNTNGTSENRRRLKRE